MVEARTRILVSVGLGVAVHEDLAPGILHVYSSNGSRDGPYGCQNAIPALFKIAAEQGRGDFVMHIWQKDATKAISFDKRGGCGKIENTYGIPVAFIAVRGSAR
jgi:hypothetical protein